MATLGNTYLTLADMYKQQDGMGGITATIIEQMSQTNPILEDMVVMECNNGTKHLTTVRTGIPAGVWRLLYQGVQPTKTTNKQVEDTTGMLEAWSEIDSKLVKLAKNPGQFRLNESSGFLEGMNNTMASTVFYGDTGSDPEKFMGLAPRFSALSGNETSGQIINAGGSGSDNTSVWFVVWGERTCHGIYPKGTKAGLERDDKGKVTKTNPDGTVYDVHREKFCWDLGLSVRDYRYIARIANIDVSELQAGNVDIYKFMRQAYYALYQRKVTNGRAAIYCNKDVLEALDAASTPTASTTSSFARLRPMEVGGREVMTYRGMPVRECEAILNTEAQIV